jgi:non-catalytic primase subunit PriX-like protein
MSQINSEFKSAVCRHNVIKEGLDFILTHFEVPRWPRRISTKLTQGRQILVHSKEEALARFGQANYIDCRINAYHAVYSEHKGSNRQAPNFIFVDIDNSNFKTENAYRLAVSKTIKNIKDKLPNAQSTVLDTGNGCHVYQPIFSPFLLESLHELTKLHGEPSKAFLKFVEQFLSNGKADRSHNPIKSCMLRIPASVNSKCNKQVIVKQKWNGHSPAINYLLGDFRRYLIQQKINSSLEEVKRQRRHITYTSIAATVHDANSHTISWIESLLETPLSDHRKYCLWRILSPYLLNVKKLSNEEAYCVMNDWLGKCEGLERLNFNTKTKIKEAFRTASKGYYPIRLQKLRQENKPLYNLIGTMFLYTFYIL